MRKTLAIVSLLAAVVASAEPSDRNALLDSLITQQNYDQLLYRLFPQASQGRVPPLTKNESEGDVSWLRVKAEEGHVPLMYFLSWKLMGSDLEESRKWNARARIGIMLDQKDCARDPRSPWYMIFEGRLIANNMTVRDSDPLWYRAVDEALSWHAAKSGHPSMAWYCGSANLLPADAASEGRLSYWKTIKEHNDKKLASL
jgi:hypothetical protein